MFSLKKLVILCLMLTLGSKTYANAHSWRTLGGGVITVSAFKLYCNGIDVKQSDKDHNPKIHRSVVINLVTLVTGAYIIRHNHRRIKEEKKAKALKQ